MTTGICFRAESWTVGSARLLLCSLERCFGSWVAWCGLLWVKYLAIMGRLGRCRATQLNVWALWMAWDTWIIKDADLQLIGSCNDILGTEIQIDTLFLLLGKFWEIINSSLKLTPRNVRTSNEEMECFENKVVDMYNILVNINAELNSIKV